MAKLHFSSLLKPLAGAAFLCAFGANAHAIGLLQAYEAALKNDATYRAAFFDNEAGKENRVLGRAGLLPSINSSYTTSKNHNDVTSPNFFGDPTTTHPTYTSKAATISLRQPLYAPEAYARYQGALAQTRFSEVQLLGRTQELAGRVVGAYIDALFAGEQLALAQAQRNTLSEQKDLNDRYFAKGEGTRTDMLETQARLDLAEAQLLEAQDNQAASRQALEAMIGQDPGVLDKVTGDFHVALMPEGGLEPWKAKARLLNAEILASAFSLEYARHEIERNKAGHKPRVDLFASYSKNSNETLSTNNQDSTARSIGVQINFPLYAGGSGNASTRQAAANYERAKAELQARTDKVMLELRKQYDIVVGSQARVKALDKAVASGQLLVQATTQSIKGGVRINLDLLNAQQQMFQSQRDLAQARYNYLISMVRMRTAAGTMGIDDVRQIATFFRRGS